MLDADRFAKVCELLTSPHPAERAVAADKASAMLEAAGITWTELVGMAARQSAPEAPQKSPSKFGIAAADIVRELQRRKRQLSEWEKEFIRNLNSMGRGVALSDKQWAVVLRLAVKVGIVGQEAAA